MLSPFSESSGPRLLARRTDHDRPPHISLRFAAEPNTKTARFIRQEEDVRFASDCDIAGAIL
jgi:hypothetical protein